MLSRLSYRSRIVLTMLVIMLLVVAIGGSIAEQIARNAVLKENEIHAQERAAEIAAEIENTFIQIASFPRILSVLADTLGSTAEERLAWYNATIPALFKAAPAEVLSLTTFFEPDFIEGRLYAEVWYIRGENGQIVPVNTNIPGEPDYDASVPIYDYFVQDWYTAPLQSDALVWSEPYFDDGGANVNMVTASIPVRYGDDLIGVATADVQLSTLDTLISEFRPTEGSYALLISKAGTFIAYPQRPNLALNGTIEQYAADVQSQELAELGVAMSAGEEGFRYMADPLNQQPAIVSYHPVAETGWSVAVVTPEADLLAPVGELRRSLLGVGALAIAGMAVASWFGASSLLRPLQVLLAGIERFGTDRSALQLGIRRGDELGKLATAFEQMSNQVAHAYDDLEQQVIDRTAKLQQSLAEQQAQASDLAAALAQLQQRDQEIQALSVPIVPLSREALVLPLVGLLDPQRTSHLIERLLRAVEAQRARVVILDVTGLALVDMAVAKQLLNAAHAVRLLGAEVIVVGIRPDMAEALVNIGLSLDGLRTLSNLQVAVGEVLRR
jgi:phosphoserine phosphatase RsbU/P